MSASKYAFLGPECPKIDGAPDPTKRAYSAQTSLLDLEKKTRQTWGKEKDTRYGKKKGEG